MEYLQQVQRGIDYIEANLAFEVQAADVARHAGISQWLDIAIASGFDTQVNFTRAFKKAFSVAPAHYRKYADRLSFMRKVRFDSDYLNHLHQGLSLEPEISDHPEMLVVGMRTAYFGVDSEKNNIGEKLPQLWSAFLPRLEEVPHKIPGGGYGVVRQIQEHSDQLEYWAAVPVTHIDDLPRGLESLRMPPARYARFAHRGFVANVDMTVNYIYSSWLLRSGLRHTNGCDLEFYGTEYQPDSDKSVIYYAIPVNQS